MPNWVFNSLTINDTIENLKKIKDNLSKSYKTYYDNKECLRESELSFWNIIKPEDSILEEYFTIADATGMNLENNWYNWNIRNWGCKWDAGSVEMELNEEDATGMKEDSILEEYFTIEDKCLYYRFDTAWSPPIPVIEELAKQHPTASISFSYQEETGWGGTMKFEKGKISLHEQYENAFEYDCEDDLE